MNTDKVININAGEVCRSFPVVEAIRAGNPEVIRLLTRRAGGGVGGVGAGGWREGLPMESSRPSPCQK